MLTALAGALAIGLSLGLLGSGGSILTVPVLHYLLGQPEQAAIGGSLFVVGMIAATAAIPHAVARRVAWRDVLAFGLPGMAGAWVGASLAHWIPGVVQLSGFALAMLVAGWRMLKSTPSGAHEDQGASRRIAVAAAGMGVGVLSGIVGVGGGFLIVPALLLLARVPMSRAVGTSLVVITLNSFTAFARYQGVLETKGVDLDWTTLCIVAAVGIAGSFLGHRIGRSLPQLLLRRIFGVVLLVLAGAMVVDVAGRVTEDKPAPPLDGSGRLASLEVREALFQGRELLARPAQHRALHVEFLAGHKIEPGQLRLQHTLEVLLEVSPQGAHVLGHGTGKAAGKVIDHAGVESHGDCGVRGRRS